MSSHAIIITFEFEFVLLFFISSRLNATDLQVWLSEKSVWSDQAAIKEEQFLKKSAVDKLIIHPDFDPSTLNHEIALLRLSNPVRLSDPVVMQLTSVSYEENEEEVKKTEKNNESQSHSQVFTPVCLPKYDMMMEHQQASENEKKADADADDAYISSLKGTVVSWDKKGRTSYSLVETRVPFVNGISKCLEMIRSNSNKTVMLNDNMLCAGDMEHDVKDSCAVY